MSKLRGVGLDLCAIDRMESLCTSEAFLKRYFTAEEAAYIAGRGQVAAQSMAGIFAAKEAFVKALGVGLSLPMRDIGISHTPLGQPFYVLTGEASAQAAHCALSLSITHEGNMAAAVCIIMEEEA